MNMRKLLGPVLLSCITLAACSKRDTQDQAPASTAPVEQSTVETGPSVAAPTSAINDPAVINFAGFGPAQFGANEEAVRMAWGRPLVGSEIVEGSTCQILGMDPHPPDGRGIWFMIEDGKFVRYDVDVPLHVAPGDIVVGDTADKVRSAHAGRVEEQPHKYLEGGKVLIVTPAEGGEARLVFEIGAEGKVLNWRIGVPPQVHYVEGCG
jgi:hypothetical protein